MNIKLPSTLEFSAPAGTKVITNGEWLTLARKKDGKYFLFTCLASQIYDYDLNDELNWTPFTKKELAAIIKL